MFLTLWYVGLPVRRTMTAPAVAAALLVFSALRSCQATPCVLPQPGKCTTDNSSSINNTQVCGLEAGNCRFTKKRGLCSYQQGCADQGMSNWTANQGKAEAKQERSYSNDNDCYYSVLESPWLNFSLVSCLKFAYLRTKPSALDVFLDRGNGQVLTLLNRSHNANDGVKDNIGRDINPGIGKVIFRAYGGGGGISNAVQVFKVSVEPGNCTWSVISSSSTASPASSGQCVPLPPSTTTDQTSTQGSGLITTRPLMTSTVVDPMKRSAPKPTTTSTADSMMTSTSRPTPDTAQPVIFPTTSDISDHSQDSRMGGSKGHEGSDDFNSTVLPAVLAAIGVVLIIVIIILVVLLIRRRRRSKRDQSESPTQRQDQSNGVMAPKTQDKRRDSYSEIRASHFDHSTPVEDSGYFESDEVARHSPDPEIDPYEQIPEDTSRDTQDPEDDDYSHISARGYPDGAVPPEIAEDDYHHISTPESAPKALASSAYTQVQKKGQPAEKPAMGYAYTQVNKKGKKMAVQDTADLNNAYSKTSQKPAVAPKPGHRKGDGNTATTETQNFDDENLDGVSDTYNRINASATSQHSARSPHNRPDPDTDTYNRIDMATGSGNRGPSPSVDVDDDYNSLDFDNTAQGNETSTNSYDHVCSNPDDDYSRADGGKKLVVMDSSYDRVRFFDA